MKLVGDSSDCFGNEKPRPAQCRAGFFVTKAVGAA